MRLDAMMTETQLITILQNSQTAPETCKAIITHQPIQIKGQNHDHEHPKAQFPMKRKKS